MTTKTMTKPKFNIQDAMTKESSAKGGRAGRGKNKKAMAVKLAEVVIDNAKKERKLSKGEMLRIAGYSPEVVHKGGGAAAWSTQGLREALERRGFTADKMTRVLEEAADAKVVTVFKGQATESDAPDHAIRLRAVDQLSDVMGLKKVNIQTINVDVNMSEEETKRLLGI